MASHSEEKNQQGKGQPEKGSGSSFEWFLVATAVLLILTGIYESFTQKNYPALSILRTLHGWGFLKDYPIIHEPSKGIWHAIGWTGSGMMVVMMLYSVRKRVSFMRSFGSMRHWLSAHMFLGIMGPILVTFHTTFKFNGIVATSFWCMIITMVFGIIGRYIYVQIPRSMTGAELDEKDINAEIEKLDGELAGYMEASKASGLLAGLGLAGAAAGAGQNAGTASAIMELVSADLKNPFRMHGLKKTLMAEYGLDARAAGKVVSLLKKKTVFLRKKNFLATSHKLLHFWHVLHVPLAGVMFLIMFIHIAVYFVFRSIH